MKKLMSVVLLATFIGACTENSIEEDDYENGVQIIDKEHARRFGKQGGAD